ncbi:GrpB family protein [Sphingobacterium siyangense]|uniref:GrpB family protein n=1 Tax=Sphingobacterium siyangense TaxID=459529 RepID=UPI003DA2A8FA
MILPFEPYNPIWKANFDSIQNELLVLLKPIRSRVDHIGSTAVEGLSAKPIIDILIGLEEENDLDLIPFLLQGKCYVYYEKYNEDMPYRRFFVALIDRPEVLGLPEHIAPDDEIPARLHDHSLRIAHIHSIPTSSVHWLRHIAFRDYLRVHEEVRGQYQVIKEKLILQQWKDGNDYNDAKDEFLKEHEAKAVQWYKKVYGTIK